MSLKAKKIFSVVLVVFLLNFKFANVYALINENYINDAEANVGIDLEQKIESSIFMFPIATLIYGFGSLVEFLVSQAFGALTGEVEFPWADRLIFNAVSMLDINFLNPSIGSMFDNSNENNILMDIIMKVYYTIFMLAISFFAVAIAVMSIKLIISTLADKKAKYKTLLTQSAVALFTLFIVHFVIAFIFYSNEQLVKMASKIAVNNLDYQELREAFNNAHLAEDVVEENFETLTDDVSQMYDNYTGQSKALLDEVFGNAELKPYAIALLNNADYRNKVLEMSITDEGKLTVESERLYKVKMLCGAAYICANSEYQELIKNILNENRESIDNSPALAEFFDKINKDDKVKANYLTIANQDIDLLPISTEGRIKSLLKSELELEKNELDGLDKESWNKILTMISKNYVSTTIELNNGISIIVELSNKIVGDQISSYMQILNYYKEVIDDITNNEAGDDDEVIASNRVPDSSSLISSLGNFFKQAAWSDVDILNITFKANNIQGAILYAIFVCQSVFFFATYLRRFFYIIILAMLAPIIIMFDLLSKMFN